MVTALYLVCSMSFNMCTEPDIKFSKRFYTGDECVESVKEMNKDSENEDVIFFVICK